MPSQCTLFHPAEYVPTPSQYHCLRVVYVSSSAYGPDTLPIFHFAAAEGGSSCSSNAISSLELGSWGPFPPVCQTGGGGLTAVALYGFSKKCHLERLLQVTGLYVVAAMAAVLLAVIGLAVFVGFFFLPSDSSGTSLLVLASSVPPAE